MSKTQMSPISGLTHASLIVEDQDAVLAFYTEKLGFELKADIPMEEEGDRWVTIAVPGQEGVEIALHDISWYGGRDEEQLRPLVGNNPMLVYAVEDCQAAYEDLRARGVEFVSEPKTQDYGTEAIARDVEGNTLFLVESNPDYGM
ncbi:MULTISPECIES: VOC family protein [unclassified Haladaptatus]|uniref:VOC family protein n=1 Tax=unclassified Haladaptatus TaxID=2622732 RepID=UPI0023E8EE8F|nr:MULTISPECIES: VOC family protein [unclassified Haladaptatus]